MAGWRRGGAIVVGSLLGLAAMLAVVDRHPLGRDYYTGPVGDHFDGRRFFNPEGEAGTGGAQQIRPRKLIEMVTRSHHDSWPTVAVTPTVPPRRVAGAAMRATWIGHSTVLVQTQGLNILTDPVWSARDSPVSFAGPKRMRAPGVRLADLPRIDLILLSHNHYDHLDLATMKALWRRDRPTIVTALGNDRLLARHGVPAIGRDWGQRVPVRPGIAVVVERAHHWSGRWLLDKNRTLWCGFTVTLPGGNLYYAGDTGRGDLAWVRGAASRGPVRLAILPIGAYHPGLLETGNHIDPVEAVAAFGLLRAAYALGVHWGTFELTNEAIDDPPKLLAATLARDHLSAARFRTLEAGGGWDVPALTPPARPAAARLAIGGVRR